jgi:alkanesulfonate monooxygenase SsuD/methylene tetrahydromethanopterin reductase-like flavin-dependent oxidoreductase (luciferase family)
MAAPPAIPDFLQVLRCQLWQYLPIDLVVAKECAEALGFHTLWFAENPFGRAILPAVSACAADTSRVRLGLGILNPYQHHDPDCAAGGGAR